MKRLLLVVTPIVMSLMFGSCGGDDPEPYPDITGLEADITELEADIDKKFEALQADIKGLQTSITQGTPPPVIEGAVPVEIKDPVEEVQDRTGGLPPTGEPTGDPVDDPFGGVPVFGEGRIVFSRNDGIYIMGSNGAGVELVVAPDLGFRHPALSPNRESVAYLTLNAATMNRAGAVRHIKSGAEFIIENPGRAEFSFPAWSPDGKRLAYSDASDIFIVTVDPVNPEFVQITHDSNKNETPSWSPDGKQIAYSSVLDGNPNIFAIGTDGRNRIRFTNHPGPEAHPDWSPDGEHIAFMGYRDNKNWDIYIVNASTFVVTQVTDGKGGYVEPTWSPDGSKIAMSGGKGDIYVINADGTGLTNITNTPNKGEGSPDWQ